MNKAIFLDRDGVLNQEIGRHLFHFEEFKINDGVWDFLSWAKKEGYIFIVITNQSGIARGTYGHELVHQMHAAMSAEAATHDITFHEIYYCPHLPEVSECLCRKPKGLFFEKAIAKYNIDVARSFMIGDKERDIIPAESLGIRGIQIVANTNLTALIPQLTA